VLISRGLKTLREEGIAAFLVAACKRIGKALFSTNAADWYAVELGVEGCEIERPAAVTLHCDLFEEAIDWMHDLRSEFGWVWNANEIDAAREFNHLLPLIRKNGQNVGYIKIGIDEVHVEDFGRRLRVSPGTALIYDTFVHPDCRSQGMASWAVSESMRYLAENDYSVLWCHIPRWNLASIRCYARCGFRRICYVRSFRVFRRTFTTRNVESMLANTGDTGT
jgi:ribosomal protein S18 acetylase RimI-like enzyme